MRPRYTRLHQEQEMSYDPVVLAQLPCTQGVWHETDAEIAAALVFGEEKALLLHWVRREMRRRLTPRERRFLEQHYFKAVEITELARQHHVHKTTVHRNLRRAVEKLRQAARLNERDTPADQAVIRAIKLRNGQ